MGFALKVAEVRGFAGAAVLVVAAARIALGGGDCG